MNPCPLHSLARVRLLQFFALAAFSMMPMSAWPAGNSQEIVEVGQNDFQINRGEIYGEDGLYQTTVGAAWNAHDREYLVVWEGAFHFNPLKVDPILGQIIAASGVALFPMDLKVGEENSSRDGSPTAVWNSHRNTFLVSWEQGVYTGVYLQCLNHTGIRTSENDYKISTIGSATMPAVAWNSSDHEFLVVWSVYIDVIGWGAIYGRRVTEQGSGIEDHEFLISEIPNPFEPSADAVYPSVVWNSFKNEYLVVWNGSNENYTELTNSEVFGRRITNTGEYSGDQFVISNSGTNFLSGRAKVGWNEISNEYFVVWNRGPLYGDYGDEPWEIIAQVLGDGVPPFGDTSFSISHSIIGGSTDFNAFFPDIVWNEGSNEYLVVWSADQVSREEFEIYGRRLNAQGELIGEDKIRISDMGPDGDNRFVAYYPVVAANPEDQEYLVAWKGDDDANGLTDGQFGIFGQRLGYVPAPTPTLVNPGSDINGDHRVDAADLMLLLEDWEKSEAHEAGR